MISLSFLTCSLHPYFSVINVHSPVALSTQLSPHKQSTLSMSQATMTMMIQDYDGLTNQLLATLQDPEFNDVKIETLDGDVVEVNKIGHLPLQ